MFFFFFFLCKKKTFHFNQIAITHDSEKIQVKNVEFVKKKLLVSLKQLITFRGKEATKDCNGKGEK
jgi:hypothetical protein